MNVCQCLVRASQLFPEREAIVFEGERTTYAELESRSRQAAEHLRQQGVREGDRVGIVVPNVPAFAVWYYACLRLGAVAVSVNTRLAGEEVGFILADSGARVAVVVEELREAVEASAPDGLRHVATTSDDAVVCNGKSLNAVAAGDASSFVDLDCDVPATILYTSGTTGFPKGATLSHRNVLATVHAFNHLCRMHTDDRLLLAVPLFHCYGQNALMNAGFHVGATLVLQRRFDLNDSKRLIASERVTKLFGVPTTFQLLLESCSPADLQSIDYCFSAAATLPIQTTHEWLAKFEMPIYEGYGLTETAPFASYNHELKYVPGSLGTPVDLVEMKIVDPDTGLECPPGSPGEIAIRGPNVMLGYWNRPEETAAVLRDGWFYSGDVGRQDENGYFYMVDRLKDMIAVGGLKVFPAEVERVLLDHPDVVEAAVVGQFNELLGEQVKAFVVRDRSSLSADELRQFCQQHLASFKAPAAIEFVDDLPRNPAGKVLKRHLRAEGKASSATVANIPRETPPRIVDVPPVVQPPLAAANQPAPLVRLLQATPAANRVPAMTTHLLDEVRQLLGEKAEPSATATFIDAGMDSLMIVALKDRLQEQAGERLEVPATLFFDYPTPKELSCHLVESLEQRLTSSSDAAQPTDPDNQVRRDQVRRDQVRRDQVRRDQVRRDDASTAAAAPESRPSPTSKVEPSSSADSIEFMSEQDALNALLRELNE